MTVDIRILVGYLTTMLLVVPIAYSEKADLGEIGQVYQIAEADFLEHIMQRLDKMKSDGELARINKKMEERAKQYVQKPAGIRLPRALRQRSLVFNPTLVLNDDIRDSAGKMLYRKGTRIKPTDYVSLSRIYCFVDGDDAAQLQWVKTNCSDRKKNKIILVSGEYLKISKNMNQRIYFDQKGQLIKRFGITELPAIVRQHGREIYVEQIPVN